MCDNFVLLGHGNGTFAAGAPYAEAASVPGPLVTDVNRDGKLDIVSAGVHYGDGVGGFTLADSTGWSGFAIGGVRAAADLNRDGFVDLVVGELPDAVVVVFGSPAGFIEDRLYEVVEGFGAVIVSDVNADGHPDIVVNASADPEGAGLLEILFGDADGTFTGSLFSVRPGPIAAADMNGDGLPDIAGYDPHAIHVLVGQRNDTNHAPVVPAYSITSGYPCVTLAAKASDPDQHALFVEWFDATGAEVWSGLGDAADAKICVDQAGTYNFKRTADDGRGGVTSGVATLTYQATLKEIVLYAAAPDVESTGNWSRVADPTAAGGFRAYDRNLSAPKVLNASATPANTMTIPFLPDPTLTYKLWVRLKADANSWTNDSVWVQFSNAFAVPSGNEVYATRTPSGLAVNLEECAGCGVSDWGWEDDGWGAVNRNGVLLRFGSGPQTIVIQTREDGVSIDQVVLSAEKYLRMRPGAAKNDDTILPATQVP